MAKPRWTAENIPDQSGRVAVVTGANSGLGLIAARELAKKGASVVMACRNMEKGEAARDEVAGAAPDADVSLVHLDLADLSVVESAANEIRGQNKRIDLLINNAGVMAPPRSETVDGFELQFGSNHLGHFALTGRLLPGLEGREAARVVTVSSTAHHIGRINLDDLQGERRYRRWRAYGQSKLANLIFALELDRRLRAAGSTVSSMAAHPGYAATNLQSAAAPLVDRLVMKVSNLVVAQGAETGTLPLLYAATEPGLEGGSYVGPDGPGEQRGFPKPNAAIDRTATDLDVAERLWDVSEELTGVDYGLRAAA